VLNESVRYKIENKKEKTDVIEIKATDKSVKIFEFNIDSKSKLGLFSLGYESAKKYYERSEFIIE
jgi:hypothetical protein